jgi:integrase
MPDWTDHVGQWVDHLEEAQKSPRTVANYRNDAAVFAAWYRGQYDVDPELPQLGKRDVLDWKAALEKTGGRKGAEAKLPTVNRKLAAMNSFLRWAHDREIILRFDAVKPNKRQGKPKPKSLEADERRAFINAVEDAGDSQHILIMRLGLDIGLRVSEMAALKWDHVKISDRKGWVRVAHGKGNKEREVPMTPALRKAFLDHGWNRHKGTSRNVLQGRLKPLSVRGIQDIVERYGRKARVGKRVGLQGFSAHSLRHTCAYWLLNEKGMEITDVAEILGHSDVKTTQLYLRPHKGKLADRMSQLDDD